MILKGKKVVIMGVRNKWSIAWGAAKAAYDQGAEVICTCTGDSLEKVKDLLKETPGASVYVMEDVGSDESIDTCLEEIKKDHGKIDGFLHAIAHAFTEDLRNDFILTSRNGYAHAVDVSSYSLVAITRMAKEKDMLNEGASIIAFHLLRHTHLSDLPYDLFSPGFVLLIGDQSFFPKTFQPPQPHFRVLGILPGVCIFPIIPPGITIRIWFLSVINIYFMRSDSLI